MIIHNLSYTIYITQYFTIIIYNNKYNQYNKSVFNTISSYDNPQFIIHNLYHTIFHNG